jgi:16S rRNA (guanine527-N7)-methyltransferase
MNVGQGALAADKARALALTPVSRETEKLLDSFVETLLLATEKQNLIGPSTIPTVWTRHVADSLQLLDLAPDAKTWVDFGTGAGFPGIPIACALKDRPGAMVRLVESVGKKAAFLREAVAELGVPAQVDHMRAEDFAKSLGTSIGDSVDVVTARAVSPLKVLFELAFPLIERGGTGIFPKGQDVDAELTEAARYWIIEAKKAPSKTSPDGSIVVVTGLTRRKHR